VAKRRKGATVVGLGAGAGVIVLTAGLWWAGAHIRSTSEAAADALPPPPGMVSAAVVTKTVAQTVTLSGAVARGSTEAVPGPASGGGGTTGVVTRVAVRTGQSVRGGTLIADVSGRPVFVLPGDFPMYRTLAENMSGPDVAELQHALSAIGYGVTDPSGHFGGSTLAAVEDLYAGAGYTMVTSSAGTSAATDAVGSRLARTGATADGDPRASPSAAPDSTASATPSPTSKAPASCPSQPAASPSDSSAAAGKGGAPGSGTGTPAGSGSSKPKAPVPEIPVGEIVFVPHLPAVVTSVNSGVGTTVGGTTPLVTLSAGLPRVTASLGDTYTQNLAPGLPAVVTLGGGKSYAARVAGLSGLSGSNPQVLLTPDSAMPASAVGDTASVLITLATTKHPVLAVPASALRMAPDGSSAVAVVAGTGTTLVPVTTGLSGDGYVQINNAPARLKDGTRVEITSS
jgi:HlyD family secretion protein